MASGNGDGGRHRDSARITLEDVAESLAEGDRVERLAAITATSAMDLARLIEQQAEAFTALISTLAERLAALEREVAALKARGLQ